MSLALMTPATSAERPMLVPAEPCFSQAMDEATLDCAVCGGNGAWEMQDQILDADLSWQTFYRLTYCDTHLMTHFRVLDPPAEHYRLVLMPL